MFCALLPLIHIAGLGVVVDALTAGRPRRQVLNLILTYLAVNLAIALLTQLLTLADNNIMRRASDLTQRDYIRDRVSINYHYAQDKSILNLRKRSMSAHPVWLLNDLGTLFRYAVQFVGIAYLFSALSPLFLGVLLGISVLSVALVYREQALDFKYKNDAAEDERAMDYFYKAMTDTDYAKEVRVNGAAALLSRKYEARYASYTARQASVAKRRWGLRLAGIVLAGLQSTVMYLYFSRRVFDAELTVGEYTVLLSASTLLVSVLLGFFGAAAKIGKTLEFTELFRRYREHVTDNSSISASCALPMPPIDTERLRFSFENVSFTYPGTETPILKDVTFTVEPGEKIGLVGLNGSGKTTLVKLLCRLYDPTEGRILLNGVDIRRIPHGDYTRQIGIVLQDFCLFAYSVKENILFDGEEDAARLLDSLEQSGLSSRIAALPKGTDTFVYRTLEDDGVEFSGGEGQKLATARAIYKRAGCLILDEPTSALDPIAEYELFLRLSRIAEKKTAIFISHRLSSTRFCDRILVLSDGKPVQIGTHDALMREGGLYAELWEAQAKYYTGEMKA